MKICLKCKEEKPLEDFPKNKRQKDGYGTWCKTPCKSEYDRQYRQKNAERERLRKQAWNLENAERKAEVNKEWRDKNRDKVNANVARYSKTPKGKAAKTQSRHNRRARLAEVESTLTKAQWWLMQYVHDFKCAKPGCETGAQVEVEHIVPISQGGSNTFSNVQPLCGPCNRKKSFIDSTDYRRKMRISYKAYGSNEERLIWTNM
ncbi:HNH endonuclease signature motif containing protein [Streptomyces werraensis]|uniref:HNH endonuclease signature motif containing protein n=1 Tax=Streptomyces werraensis TaxID=68284 RepID=UPI0037F3EC57